MSLSQEQVRRIAQLARIKVADDDCSAVQEKLNGIISLIEKMQAVDTNGIEPMAHALDLAQRLRPDLVTEIDQREKFQRIAPENAAGLYLVPRVIE